jgi:ABC transporter substrate binding protein
MSLKEEEEASPKLPQASQHDSRLALCGSSREREEAASDRNTCTRHDSSAQRLAVSPIVFGWDARARIFRGPRLRHSRPSSRIYRRLVRLNPDVILAGASAHAIAAKLATSTIPIVVPALGNPIALGLIETDARPGGNLTGIMPYIKGLPTKQIELAREIGTTRTWQTFEPTSSNSGPTGRRNKPVASPRMCVSAATLPNVPTRIAKISWEAGRGMFDNR